MRTPLFLSVIAAFSAAIAIARADEAPRPAPRPMQLPNGGAPIPGGSSNPGFAPRLPPSTPPPAMPAPVPAPEVVAAIKAMKGSWRCRGFLTQPDGSSTPTTGTMKFASDLDGFWLTSEYTEAKARTKTPAAPHPTRLRMSRTFDASPMTWTGTLAMGSVKVATRDHEEYDAKSHVQHIWGEFSLDGRTFQKTYDLRCQK